MESDAFWGQSDVPRVVRVPATPAMLACLEQAYRAALVRLAFIAGIPLVLVCVTIVTQNLVYGALGVVLAIGLNVPRALRRAYRLMRAQAFPSVARVRGPVVVTEHRRYGSSWLMPYDAYWVTLTDSLDPGGNRPVDIDGTTYRRLVDALVHAPDEPPSVREMLMGMRHDEVPEMLATYSRTARLLLELRHLDGTVIYQHRAYEDEESA